VRVKVSGCSDPAAADARSVAIGMSVPFASVERPWNCALATCAAPSFATAVKFGTVASKRR